VIKWQGTKGPISTVYCHIRSAIKRKKLPKVLTFLEISIRDKKQNKVIKVMLISVFLTKRKWRKRDEIVFPNTYPLAVIFIFMLRGLLKQS
jgi:hypothetical protein